MWNNCILYFTYIWTQRQTNTMQHLPLELYREINQYLTLQEHQRARTAYTFFTDIKLARKLRFDYCKKNVTPRTITNGKCICTQCTHQKAMCIELEPLRSKILCNYCSQHARLFLDININDLL
jgi:hypothetical protein